MRLFFRPLLLLLAVLNISFVLAVFGQKGESHALVGDIAGLSQPYQLSDLFLTQRVAALVESQYVDPRRIDPPEMFDKALEQVQRDIPEVMFDYDRTSGVVNLFIDEKTERVEVGQMASVQDVVNGLRLVLGRVGTYWQGDGKLDPPEVEYAAINGLLSTLDPHSILLPPENAKDMDVQIQGQFGGLGITISLRGDENMLTVVNVLDETPAARAGLKAGDEILQIEDESTVNMDLTEAVEKLRGPVGSRVSILVGRKTFDAPRTFNLRRDLIRIDSVEAYSLGDGYGYVKIKTFQHNTYQQLVAALSQLRAQGPVKGLILDLRNNPGGPLQQAIEVADRFLEQGTIVSTVQSYTREKEVKRARRTGTEEPYPIAVILDSNSASASEIVAGALKNQDRAIIIGETSFGKGSVQNLFPNPDDSKLKLTMLQYLTPGDQSIQSVGITPDVRLSPVYFDEEMVYLYSTAHMFRERDLEAHLDTEMKELSEQEPPVATIRYFAAEEFRLPGDKDEAEMTEAEKAKEEEEALAAAAKKNPMEDFQVRFARQLLAEAGRGTRKATLLQAEQMLGRTSAEQRDLLAKKMTEVGVDWAQGTPGAGPVDVQVRFGTGDGPLVAGAEVPVTVRVTNKGETPLHQVHVITHSDLPVFDQVEFLFGKIEPGATREWKREIRLAESFMSLAEPVDFKVLQGDSEVPVATSQAMVRIEEQPQPAFAFTVVPVDDGSGKSRGNGDGRIQRGEAIDLMVIMRNVGQGPSKKAWFRVHNNEGRHVYLKSGTVTFDPIAPGEYGVRRLHFEVRDTLPEDQIHFDVRTGDVALLPQAPVDIKLPVAPNGGAVAPKAEASAVQVKKDAQVRAWPADAAPVFGTLPSGAVLQSAARDGQWVRVTLPLTGGESVPAWVPADKVASSSAQPTDGGKAFAPAFDHWAPQVNAQVASYQLPATSAKLQVTGTLTDDQGLKSVYAFVNGKKRFYWSVPDAKQARAEGGVKVPLKLELPLQDGVNTVEIYARDKKDLMTAEVFRVYREPSVKAAANTP